MNCTVVKVENLVSAFFFFTSETKTCTKWDEIYCIQILSGKKKLKESACIGIAGQRQEDNIKMDFFKLPT
jgi:hypothetical protein